MKDKTKSYVKLADLSPEDRLIAQAKHRAEYEVLKADTVKYQAKLKRDRESSRERYKDPTKRVKIQARNKTWKDANPEKARASHKKWYEKVKHTQEYKDKRNKYSRDNGYGKGKYTPEVREKIMAHRAEHQDEYRAYQREYHRKWAAENVDKVKEYERKSRAKKKAQKESTED